MDLILFLLAAIIPLIAQLKINSAYKKLSKKNCVRNISGQEIARTILDNNGLNNIYVVETSGELTDHYDPTRKVVKLSKAIYENDSIASISVAAHECGHAIQDKTGYLWLKIRSTIVPVVNFCNKISYFVLLAGVILEIFNLIYLAIALIAMSLIFQIVTLPVEFDASKRALEEMKKYNLINSDEEKDVKEMLTSAALTYVAGVLSSALYILRLINNYRRR